MTCLTHKVFILRNLLWTANGVCSDWHPQLYHSCWSSYWWKANLYRRQWVLTSVRVRVGLRAWLASISAHTVFLKLNAEFSLLFCRIGV